MGRLIPRVGVGGWGVWSGLFLVIFYAPEQRMHVCEWWWMHYRTTWRVLRLFLVLALTQIKHSCIHVDPVPFPYRSSGAPLRACCVWGWGWSWRRCYTEGSWGPVTSLLWQRFYWWAKYSIPTPTP